MGNADASAVQSLGDPAAYVNIWAPLCEGLFLPTSLVSTQEGFACVVPRPSPVLARSGCFGLS
jgi:hypothetical protein